ncbi:hypothetical protein [Asticcacaulis sp. AND118]|uniref:hypothetical protein n=1 Tax=Asticcacaulis sp. AND118 TaxID=2840468 RepID=UPI001D0005DD|nr:hypothetical protein [Asticcacaulis sp. AND118]UDF02592.1 hypothetical protein LH365_09105 [Asticcacaulis sp. AND118]
MTDTLKDMFARSPMHLSGPARDPAFELRVLEAVERRRFRTQMTVYAGVAGAVTVGGVFLTPILSPLLALPALPVFLSVIGVLPGLFLAGRQLRAARR